MISINFDSGSAGAYATQAAVKADRNAKYREELGAVLTCLVRVNFREVWSSNCKSDTGKKYDGGWH